jgi:hypothetical protein
MPGRGSQTFQKRQKEQQRKEKQQEKFAKRLAAKNAPPSDGTDEHVEEENDNGFQERPIAEVLLSLKL